MPTVLVDHRSPKEEPNQIWITAGRSLINCPGELTTKTADITISTLHWNSILSTQKAKYMCLDINFFFSFCGHLTDTNTCASQLDCPPHGSSSNRTSTTKFTTDIFTWKCAKHSGAFLKQVSWQISSCKRGVHPMGTMYANKHLGSGNIQYVRSCSPWWLKISV
jgi:hypothetical protein